MPTTSTNTPKIFISYSWTSPSHQDFVLRLAERLMSDGVHALLDRWDLQEGQDKYAFMERMVTDPEVSRVIIICDKKYTEKANNKIGGVGTESQIISSEVYDRVDQKKFIPVITEYQNDSPCLPVFLSSRLYIDLSDESKNHDEYDKLLRIIFERPAIVRPPFGKPPAHLFDDSPITVITTSTFSHLRHAIEQEKKSVTALSNQFLEQIIEALDSLRITSNDNIDDKAIESINAFRPYRNQYIDYIKLISEYDISNKYHDNIRDFFESILTFHHPKNTSSPHNQMWFDSHKFISMELFTYTIATLIKFKKYEFIDFLLSEKYSNPHRNTDRLYTYASFNNHLPLLDEYRKKRLKLDRISITADIIHDYADTKIVSFNDYMQADFILCIRSIFESKDWSGQWFPRSLAYKDSWNGTPFPLFLRAESKQGFEIIKLLLNISSKTDFESKLTQAYAIHGLQNWKFDYHPIPFNEYLNMKNIYKD